MKKWKIIKSERVLNDRWKKVDKQIVQVPAGSKHEWFIERMLPIVAVFAVTQENKVVLVKLYKHGAGAQVLEIPHGLAEKGELLDKAAKREFREETGFEVKSLKKIGQYYFSPTGSDGMIHLFFGKNVAKVGSPHHTPTEITKVVLATPPKLRQLIKQGKINSQSGIAAVMVGLEYLGA